MAADPVLAIQRVRLEDIHPDPANVNTHDSHNLAQIVASLQEFGQVEPLVVQKDTGKVIGGNGRLIGMQKLGWTECDVVEIDADNVRSAALGIALNRTAKTSTFDDLPLARVLEAIRSEQDFPIEATGFNDGEIDALLAKIGDDALRPGRGGDEYPPGGNEGSPGKGGPGDGDGRGVSDGAITDLPQPPAEGNYREQYAVIVLCRDEADQKSTYERLQSDGYACKVVVT